MGYSEESSSSDDVSLAIRDRKRKSKSRKRHKDRKERKKKRRYYSSSSSDEDEDDDRRRRKRKKKEKKKKKKASKRDDKNGEPAVPDPLDRNHALTEALVDLLEEHPALVEDLPLLLIRLGSSGTAFDLSQMTDRAAAEGIARVFSCLQPFGVAQDANGSWVWKSPDSGGGTNQELFLVKLVRALLDQIGITMEAIETVENPVTTRARESDSKPASMPENSSKTAELTVEQQTKALLDQFRTGDLAKELASLCSMILEGESIAIDGLPDEKLRTALEGIFVHCGLEKSEMNDDESEDEQEQEESTEEESEPTFGFALPEEDEQEVRSRLQSVLKTCSIAASKPRIKGPMMRPSSYKEPEPESSDEEGPLPVGSAGRKAPTLSNDVLQARAASRQRQLELAKQGMDPSVAEAIEGNAREEWMLVPGKFDFLSAVKSGQPIRSRGFEAKSKAATEDAKPMDPAVRAEIDAIRKAHEESRGPSLLEVHREKKAMEAKEKEGKSESWRWNRDKDLDSGRRVDKNALNMIFGGAGSDLKKKFQGGF